MWRVVEAARVAQVAMVAHRAEVPRVAQMEQEMVPAIEAMMTGVDALVALIERRKVALAVQATHVDELYRRTQYWLTYVRMDMPSYQASSMTARASSVKSVIERAHRMLTVVSAETEPHDYVAQLRAEMVPLYERSVREREEAEATTLELTRVRTQVRALMVPVFRGNNTLRKLLRNSLGSAHPHVRGLNMSAPKSAKRDVVNAVSAVMENSMLPHTLPQPTAPTTAERLALVR